MIRGGRPRGLFVVGTDTGVGKTTVSVALLRQARRRGRAPIPFKPVETGCNPVPEDAGRLWRAARPPIAESDACLYALRLPAAPSQAALAEDRRIDLDLIVGRALELASKGDFLLVEGAGGLLVPYADGATTVELALRLELPLLVVARTALGTVNHTALTLREIARSRLAVAGLIFNRVTAPNGPHEGGNAGLVALLTGQTSLGTLPFLPGGAETDPDLLADALERSIGDAALDALLGLAGPSAPFAT
jgi:dethiobiotin synthetase